MDVENRKRHPITHIWATIVAGFLSFGVLGSGCSHTTRHQVLSFFFDGVPKDQETAIENIASPPEQAPQAAASTASNRRPLSSHPALTESECETCHTPDQANSTLDAPEKLCLICHDDEINTLYVHVPAEEGDCLECHNPHGTRNPKLLVKTGQALCFGCHDEETVKATEMHEGIEDAPCYECHDPHGGDNEYFLR